MGRRFLAYLRRVQRRLFLSLFVGVLSAYLTHLAYPDPPYGRRAELCFDPDSGALRYLRRELDGIVEEQEAIAIRTDVTDADFDLTYDPEYDPAGDLPELDLDDLDEDPASTGTAPPTSR